MSRRYLGEGERGSMQVAGEDGGSGGIYLSGLEERRAWHQVMLEGEAAVG